MGHGAVIRPLVLPKRIPCRKPEWGHSRTGHYGDFRWKRSGGVEKARRATQSFRIMPGQGKRSHRASRWHAPWVAQGRVLVRNQGRQTGVAAAGRRSLVGGAMHMAGSPWMLMAMPRLMRPVAHDQQGAGVRKVMIVEV